MKAFGLVDEVDGDKPGHLSDHIEPISTTTTVRSRPLHGTLEERFVKGESETGPKEEGGSGDVSMATEEDEGKENKAV